MVVMSSRTGTTGTISSRIPSSSCTAPELEAFLHCSLCFTTDDLRVNPLLQKSHLNEMPKWTSICLCQSCFLLNGWRHAGLLHMYQSLGLSMLLINSYPLFMVKKSIVTAQLLIAS